MCGGVLCIMLLLLLLLLHRIMMHCRTQHLDRTRAGVLQRMRDKISRRHRQHKGERGA